MPEQAAGRPVEETAGRAESPQVNALASLSPSDTLRAAARRLRRHGTTGIRLAGPLARWLEDEATTNDEHTPSYVPHAALDVAHAILGGAS